MEIVGGFWKVLTGRWGSGDGEIDQVRIDASTNSLQTVGYEHHEIHSGSHYYIEGTATLGDGGVLRASIMTPDSDKESHFVWMISSNGVLTSALYENPVGGMANGDRITIHANNRNKTCWSGTHTPAGASSTVLTDTSQAWTIDELIGLQVFNQTDLSSAIITDNDATTVTVAALIGGTGNNFEQDDVYEINNSQMIINSDTDAATTNGLNISIANVGGEGWKADVGGEAKRTDEIILKRNTTYLRTFTSGSAANIVSFKATWYEHEPKH